MKTDFADSGSTLLVVLAAVALLGAPARLAALGASAGIAPAAAAAATANPPQYTIDQFLATTTWRGSWFSPDGKQLLVSGNGTGVSPSPRRLPDHPPQHPSAIENPRRLTRAAVPGLSSTQDYCRGCARQ
jgi:hypothetical protein